jgi:DNA polymerase-3 subunit alpha
LKILGPVVTSRTIGKSYIQLRDLFTIAKRYGFEGIILSEPHPKSWIRFITYAQKYRIKPFIVYETNEGDFLIQTNKDIQNAISYYNGLSKDLNLRRVKINLPHVIYPSSIFKTIFQNEESLTIKDLLKYQKELSIFNDIDTHYNLKEYKFKEYKLINNKIERYISTNNLTTDEKKRLIYEMKIIKKLNVENYILTVKKIVDMANKNNIPIGPGRGSAVGSFLVYKLGITKVNPLKYDLLFERFLNEYRRELPDIDLDVDAEERTNLIKAIQKEIGEFNIAQIRTYSTMKIKSVLKKSEELLGYKSDTNFNSPIRSKENVKKFKSLSKDDKLFYTLSYYLEGLEIAESTHAAGLIISQNDLRRFSPVEKKEIPILEWEMADLKILGVEKFDVLALDTLTFLRKLNVKEKYENLNDDKTYRYLSKGLTKGIFQLDSNLGKRLSIKIKPKNFEELTLLLAINRPGPLESGMIDQYIENTSPDYMKKLLPETKGVLVYQEQIMKVAQILGGFTSQESDLLRKAVSKKKKDEIANFKEKFILTASKKIGKEQATLLFSQIENFAQYAFNKSHAVAYAHITYWLAHEKFKNTSHFFYEYINLKGLDLDIINEASFLGITINLPDISYPQGLYTESKIILPFYAIKGVGKNLSKIFENGNIDNIDEFFNFAISNNINRNIIELIIKSGALDKYEPNRKKLLRESTERLKGKIQQLEEIKSSLFGELERSSKKENETTLQDLAKYEIETIGYPLSLMHQKGLSKTLINKYFNNEKINFNGYAYHNYLIDKSGIIYSKIYNKRLIKLIKKL